ncbi:Coenzyme F420 hydrogenase/dehydrogenase, beta subunit C-terminal domain [Megamonas funiformis]|uniref:Coenzyme F420 hydrogenase/dehydrogenase, beta subunit C-terminal domain n=1 Tax=Megamonas funiformis TaxID=437897 RepID=UPI0035223856
MIEIKNKKDCCGCYACYNICPKECITMESDNEGFWYPKIDKDKCINCNLCEKVCPIINPVKRANSKKIAYAGINKDDQIRVKSSSGGIFSILAEYIIKNNGIIYGASFDENFNIKHKRILCNTDLDLLRGSKYVQSSIGDIYKQVKSDLESNRQVLFTGTPCQVEGLRSYLRKEYVNLITMDFICHGVPSPLVWKKYLEEMKKSKQENIKNIYFRNKDIGWKVFSLKIIFDEKIYINNLSKDLFMKGFLQDVYLRPSCYSCKFKKINRVSDITVADFWGIENILPKMDDDKGTSLIVIHSEKGEQLFDKLSETMILNEVNLNEAIKYNPSMIKSVKYNEKRNSFFAELNSVKALTDLIRKYTKISFEKRAKNKIKSIIKRLVR